MNKHLLVSSAAIMAAAFANAPAATPPAADDTAKEKAPRVAPVITGTFKLESIPEVAKVTRGSVSPYGFDKLAINEAFGVKNKSAHQMSSIVSNQNNNKKNQAPKTDAAGAIVYVMAETKDAAGTVIGHVPTSTPETVQVKEWRVAGVDKGSALEKQIKGTPLEGSSVIVIRVK